METIDSLIILLRERRKFLNEKYQKAEIEQSIEHNTVLQELQALRDERTRVKETIVKNMNNLTAHKHEIHRIVQDAENISGLPISHKYQEQTVRLLSDEITFINNLTDISNKPLHSDNNIDPIKLCDTVRTCGESVNDELNRAKTRIDEVEMLGNNIEIIKEHCFVSCDDDPDLNVSIFEDL